MKFAGVKEHISRIDLENKPPKGYDVKESGRFWWSSTNRGGGSVPDLYSIPKSSITFENTIKFFKLCSVLSRGY